MDCTAHAVSIIVKSYFWFDFLKLTYRFSVRLRNISKNCCKDFMPTDCFTIPAVERIKNKVWKLTKYIYIGCISEKKNETKLKL